MSRDKYLVMHKGIARWKLDNPLENWLSYKADKSEWWKRIYVWFYWLFDHKYYVGGIKMINKQLEIFKAEWHGIKRSYVVRDMIYSLHRFGADFQDYWNYGFLNLSAVGKERFVVDKLRYGYDDILSTPEVIDLVSDKYACYCKLKPYYKREALGCYNKKDIVKFRDFVQRNHQFIYKPLSSDCGKGVQKIDLAEDEVNEFFDANIVNGPFIVEQLINQNEIMARLHPHSINTVRVVTFTSAGQVNIVATSLRMGCRGAVADNAGSGGIFTSIDPETGLVVCKACNYRGEKYIKHPNTGVIIPGFQIPAWDDLKEIVHKVALELEKGVLISWDFSYSKNGWVIVEVNTGGDWIILQAAQKEPLKSRLYELIDKMKK